MIHSLPLHIDTASSEDILAVDEAAERNAGSLHGLDLLELAINEVVAFAADFVLKSLPPIT